MNQIKKTASTEKPRVPGFLDDKRFRRYVFSGGIMLNSENEGDMLHFKKILSVAASQARWNGYVPEVS